MRRATWGRRATWAGFSGFSLLEVMVALAILAMAMVVLIEITTNNVRNTNHAKLMTAATFLARTRIADMEDDVLQVGFGDNSEEDDGDFRDQGYPAFRWHSTVERVELPTDIAQQTQNQAGQAPQTNSSPMMAMAGLMGGFMTTLIDPIRIGLQESVRRVAVTVSWEEIGRPEQKLEVVLYMTDPARLDLAMQAGAAPTTQNQGTGGQGGGNTTGQGTQGGTGQQTGQGTRAGGSFGAGAATPGGTRP